MLFQEEMSARASPSANNGRAASPSHRLSGNCFRGSQTPSILRGFIKKGSLSISAYREIATPLADREVSLGF